MVTTTVITLARDIRGPHGYATEEAAYKAGEAESLRTIKDRIKLLKQEAKSGATVTATDALHEAGNGNRQEQNKGNATGSHPPQLDFAALPERDDDLTDFLERIRDGKLPIPEALTLLTDVRGTCPSICKSEQVGQAEERLLHARLCFRTIIALLAERQDDLGSCVGKGASRLTSRQRRIHRRWIEEDELHDRHSAD